VIALDLTITGLTNALFNGSGRSISEGKKAAMMQSTPTKSKKNKPVRQKEK
jgi:hypothetical protein